MRRICLAIGLAALVASGRASAQPETDRVEVEPVTCWWRTSATSVRVGETFTVFLTCSLLQTEAARVIADESRLDPSVVQLPPFEVVGGTRARDLTTAGRKFLQFEYRLRTIAENVFASEVALPPLEITYRVESRVADRDSVAGRDLTYLLPPLAIRVLSLVPDTAGDIREAPIAAFAEIEGIQSRGTIFRVAGGVLLLLGGLTLALALSRLVRRRLARRQTPTSALSKAAILRSVQRDLAAMQNEARSSGWTPDRAGQTLAAVRIVAACAAGRNVSQRLTSPGSPLPATGEVVVNGRLGPSAAVSSAVAATDDDELQHALTCFSAARYGREASLDGRLDEALEVVVRRADRLIAARPLMEKLWPR